MIYSINPKCACSTIKAFIAETDQMLDVDPKKIARLTFPVWLYVSVSGVAVYFFLRAYA